MPENESRLPKSRKIYLVEILIVNNICAGRNMESIQIEETFFCGI